MTHDQLWAQMSKGRGTVLGYTRDEVDFVPATDGREWKIVLKNYPNEDLLPFD